jgi:L,D-transpeptidase YcbB
MRRPPYDRILASTALALTIALPFGSMLTDPVQLAAAPPPGTPSEQAWTPADPATALPANGPAAAAANVNSSDPAAVAEQATAADPLATLDPADRAVAEKLRDLLATKATRLFANEKERAATIAFYENRNLAPLWLERGAANVRAEAVRPA